MGRLRKSSKVARSEHKDEFYSQQLGTIFYCLLALAFTVSLRNKKQYTTSNSQQGRRGRQQGAFDGVKPRKKQRRSTRISTEEDSSSHDDDDVPTTPPRQRQAVLRSAEITCLNYGPNRKVIYPQYHMCQSCDNFERDQGLISKKSQTRPRFYKCTAGHTHPCFPTESKKEWYLAIRRNPNNSDNEDNATDDNESITNNNELNTATEASHDQSETEDDDKEEEEMLRLAQLAINTQRRLRDTLTKDNSELNERIGALESEISTLKEYTGILENRVSILTKNYEVQKQRVTRLRNKVATGVDKTKSLAENIVDSTTATVEAYGISPSRKKKQVGEAIANAAVTVLDGIAVESVMGWAKKWLRENVFADWKIARLMDLAGGTLNLVCIDLIRTLETGGKKYTRGTIIPSSTSIKRVMYKLEKIAKQLVPLERSNILGVGECININYVNAFRLILKAYGLEEVAKERSVSFAVSFDGARLTKDLSHLMAGLKIHDNAAVNPMTGLPMITGEYDGAQSRELVIPLCFMLCGETKTSVEKLQPLFDFVAKMEAEGLDGFKAFEINVNCDMSAQWKGLCRGGGLKVHKYGCHCCAIDSDHSHQPSGNHQECKWCTTNHVNKQGWTCYHHPIVRDENIEEMKVQVDSFQAMLETSLEERKQSKLTNEDPRQDATIGENATSNPSSIHYQVPANSGRARLQYMKLIDNELRLRKVANPETLGNLSVRREALRDLLEVEWKMQVLSQQLTACERSDKALFLLMKAVPCILHMEMRVGEKLVTMLLLEGIAKAKTLETGTPNKNVMDYIDRIQTIINTQILGDPDQPRQWKCPFDYAKMELGPIHFDNPQLRKVIDKLSLLVEVSAENTLRKEKWNSCFPRYCEAMQIARQKEFLTNENINVFQTKVDEFFQDWVELFGLHGMTNYIHMLSSGHISEYMFEYRNLFQHSQQGWEAFNSLFKTFYFRRTSHGGGKVSSKLLPLARWIQRRLLWNCGFDKEKIDNFNVDISDEDLLDSIE